MAVRSTCAAAGDAAGRVLRSGLQSDFERVRPAFDGGLNEADFFEARNVKIQHRAAEDQYDRLTGLASDFVARDVTVLAAIGDPAALAAKTATTTIPIVFNTGSEPVKLGLVGSMNRPTGNLTGVSQMNAAARGRPALWQCCGFVPSKE